MSGSKKYLWTEQDIFVNAHRVKAFPLIDYQIHEHEQDFLEINLIARGRGLHCISKREITVAEGDLFVIPKHQPHAYRNYDRLVVYHVVLRKAFLSEYRWKLLAIPGYSSLFIQNSQPKKAGSMHLTANDFSDLISILERLNRENNATTPHAVLGAESLALYFIQALCARFAAVNENSSNVPGLEGVLQAVAHAQTYYAQALSLEDLAEVAHVSSATFGRNFKTVTGLSPMAFLKRIRLQAAKDLLSKTVLTVTEIALECGFYDSAHLIKSFRQENGKTPLQFRSMSRNKS